MIDLVFNGLRDVIPLDTDRCIPYYSRLALGRHPAPVSAGSTEKRAAVSRRY
jgi:hypothetical protein